MLRNYLLPITALFFSTFLSVYAATCPPPVNIQSMSSPDKKQIILAWQAPTGSAITAYQINDWQNKMLVSVAANDCHCFTDRTLPGTSGTFVYYVYAVCGSTLSQGVKYTAVIN